MRKGLKDNENILLELEEWISNYKNFCNPEVVKIKYDPKRAKHSKIDLLRKRIYGIVNRMKTIQIKVKSISNNKNIQAETMIICDLSKSKIENYSKSDLRIIIG